MKGNEVNLFEEKASVPAISWVTTDNYGNKQSVPIGTEIGGRVVKAPELVQEVGYTGTPFAGLPLFWKQGGGKTDQAETNGKANNPVTAIVTTLEVDGAERALWTRRYPPSQYQAIQQALAGRAIEVGDELYVTLTGFEKQDDASKAPAKLFSARFVKGQGAFAPMPAATVGEMDRAAKIAALSPEDRKLLGL